MQSAGRWATIPFIHFATGTNRHSPRNLATMMNQAIVQASPAMAQRIQAEHDAAQRGASDAVVHAIACGKLLHQQKAALKHGEFDNWLAANVAIPRSTVIAYMRVSKIPPDQITNAVSNLSFRQLLAIPKPPKPESEPTAKDKRAAKTAERIAEIERLVADGKTPNEIAAQIGMKTRSGLYQFADEHGIELERRMATRDPRFAEDRLSKVQQMLAEGNNVDQIAGRLGIDPSTLVTWLTERNFDVPEWARRKRQAVTSPVRVITESVNALVGIAAGLRMLNAKQLHMDKGDAVALLADARESLRVIKEMIALLERAAP